MQAVKMESEHLTYFKEVGPGRNEEGREVTSDWMFLFSLLKEFSRKENKKGHIFIVSIMD